MTSVASAIRAALLTPAPRAKCFAAREVARAWRKGALDWRFDVTMPDTPAWPDSPELLPPGQMPKRRRGGSESGRIALWHSLAHIEFVAIDLALDMAGRFGAAMGEEFVGDFLDVAADEAMHFALLARKLESLGSHYGALPAHAGLWEAAYATRGDVAARLAVVPMVLEARGLDVTPGMIVKLRQLGDDVTADILDVILREEIGHVAAGSRWYRWCCEREGADPESTFRRLLVEYGRGVLYGPFNLEARSAAGFSEAELTALQNAVAALA